MGARKKPAEDKADEALKPKRELFCRYYTQNRELFGEATLSYAEAFGYELDSLSREAIYKMEINEDTGEEEQGELIEDSPYDKAYHVCAVEASRLLKNPDIQARLTILLNELLKDEVVVSTPERNCIGGPEQNSITASSKKAPDIGGLLAFAAQS